MQLLEVSFDFLLSVFDRILKLSNLIIMESFNILSALLSSIDQLNT